MSRHRKLNLSYDHIKNRCVLEGHVKSDRRADFGFRKKYFSKLARVCPGTSDCPLRASVSLSLNTSLQCILAGWLGNWAQ